MRNGTALALTGGAVITALLVGRQNSPTPDQPATAAWYAQLEKPGFTPPGLVFGIAWPILDVLLWFSGYRLATSRPTPTRRFALGAWLLSVIGVGTHSWVFFGRKRPGEALAVTGTMLGTSVALAASAARIDKPAAYATTPLIAWLLFANLLQEEVWRRNR